MCSHTEAEPGPPLNENVIEHPAKEGLGHLDIVDLFQRGVHHVLIEDARDLDHAAVGHQIFVVGPDQDIAQHTDQRQEQKHKTDGRQRKINGRHADGCNQQQGER